MASRVAVCLNGFVRTTQDLDLLVEASPADLSRSHRRRYEPAGRRSRRTNATR
ncbi:MAG: hypothetical protein WDN28_06980 [Chthoniobacter sp.]